MYEKDGRLPIDALYRAFDGLSGWAVHEAFTERVRGVDLPVCAHATPLRGPALWIIAGIHGEEPAGPLSLAAHVDALRSLGCEVPMVVFPMCNPLGYCLNTRYPDEARVSVGDSDHLLLDAEGRARAPQPASWRCDALTRTALSLVAAHPPWLVLDFHEDDGLERGYIYTQGSLGRLDPVGARIVAELTPAKSVGQTCARPRSQDESRRGASSVQMTPPCGCTRLHVRSSLRPTGCARSRRRFPRCGGRLRPVGLPP